MYDTNSGLISPLLLSVVVVVVVVVAPPDSRLIPPPPVEALLDLAALRGELGLLENEARGTGLVSPMLLLPPVFPPDETVMVTGEEDGDVAIFTMMRKESERESRD